MSNDPHWIEHMHMKKGAFKKKAKAAGKSTSAYSTEKEHSSGKTGKQARLAKTLGNLRPSMGLN